MCGCRSDSDAVVMKGVAFDCRRRLRRETASRGRVRLQVHYRAIVRGFSFLRVPRATSRFC